jgi:KAP family P-loop domain
MFTLLSDHPIRHAEEAGDMMDLHERLSVHLDTLRHRNTQTPFTFALYGDWGTGKTSAMRWLDQQLQRWNESEKRESTKHPHLRTVWFYPWKYHNRQDVWRGIIAEVILASLSITGEGLPPLPQRLSAAGKQFGKFLGHSFLHALSNVKVKAGMAGSTEAEISGQVFQDIYEEYKNTARPHEPFLNDFEQQLTEWVSKTIDDKQRRLVIFIDDLDRCLPSVALEVLEALKLYLNIPGLMFVIGLDRDVIDQIIVKHYDDNGVSKEKAQKYLAKLFQVELDIRPSDRQSRDFLDCRIEHLNELTGGKWHACLKPNLDEYSGHFKPAIEDALRLLGGDNPREFTRLLNSLMVKAGAAQASATNDFKNMRFLQGAQVFLIERILESFAEIPAAMRHERNRELIHQLCLARRKDPEITFYVHIHPAEEMLGDIKRAKVPEVSYPYLNVLNQNPSNQNAKQIAETLSRHAWDLLLVPFERSVAASTAFNSGSVKGSSVLDMNALPKWVRVEVAYELKKPIDQIRVDDLDGVKNISLAHVDEVTDLAWTVAFPSLISLDLTETGVNDLSPLFGLSNLSELYLFGTPVAEDNEAIKELRKIRPDLVIHT